MYDYIIIGSGPAGLGLAYQLTDRHTKVALVENDRWGGLCPNYGCDPTKLMMSAVETKYRSEHLNGLGLQGQVTVDWSGLVARKAEVTDVFAASALKGLEVSAIEPIYGTASFTSDEALLVNGERYKARKYIIATGTRARSLDIPGSEYLKNSSDFLDLKDLPEDIVFLGTGSVSLELAQIANAAGAHVTVLSERDLSIRHFDSELGDSFIDQLKSEGIEFREQVVVHKVTKVNEKLILSEDKGFSLTTDYIVAGVGRLANVEDLNLPAVGVQTDKAGILVNEYLQTTNPNIYAMGDVLSKSQPKLTPVSSFEAHYIAETIHEAEPEEIQYPRVPSVIYGSTKLAQVGELSGEGIKVKSINTTGWYSYRRIADPLAKVKVAVDSTGKIIGAAVLSTAAEELINFLTIVIEQGIDLKGLKKMILAYPTLASDLQYFY